MRGLRIVAVRLRLSEDSDRNTAHVVVEWSHDCINAAQVLQLSGGSALPSSALLSEYSIDQKALTTIRTFRFELADDALTVYRQYVDVLRAQPLVEQLEGMNHNGT